jgi:hypothetical protein
MKKNSILLLCLMVPCISLWGVDANEFLIGAYSQYQVRYTGTNYENDFENLGVYLHNAGYNATVYGNACIALVSILGVTKDRNKGGTITRQI